jgi:LysR family transcriptional regulator, chromosome initiation inhibitor
LGGGMFPEQLAEPALAAGSLIQVADEHLDVPLYWQCWKIDSRFITRVTEAIQTAAVSRPR